ncbi:MAG: hypothetical protein IPN90_12125 [Elusimicrobia bacterium]|nr:hypothetical protein [Elusimicrobiota bacterium]
MRLVPSSFPFRSVLTKSLSVVLCLALVGLEAGPVFARNNDDYQNNSYSNNYGPRGGYSASNFELQMQQARARMQSFVAPPVQNFNSFRYVAPNLNLTYQPTIRFQYSLQAKTPDINAKAAVKLDTIASVQKPTFVQAVGAVFKGMGAAITSAFKKIGDGIVSLAHKIFEPNQKQEVPVTPQSQDLMGSFKNLKEIAPGLLQTQNGKTTALGQTWEPGSTFKAEGKNLRLVEGTAYAPNFGGITRADGANFPVRFADDAGKVKPIGLDFNLMAKETPLKIQAPLNIEGFGKIMGGDMVFKGTVQTSEGTLGKFQFQGAQVHLDSNLASNLGVSSPANLVRATFMARAAVMQLNSVEVQSKDKHLFVQESKPAIDLNQVETKLKSVGVGLGEAQGQFTKAERDYSNAAVASRSLLTNVAKATGQTDVAVFQEPDDLKSLRQEAHSVAALSSKVTEDMKAWNYQEVSEALPDLTVRTEIFKARSETVATQAEMTKGFFKDIRKLTGNLSTVSQVVDVGDLAGKKPLTTEAVAKGYEWFPAPEKKVFADTATHAQETLVKLVEARAVDPERALDWALSLKIAKDKVLGAGPSKLGDRISVAASHPQATLKEASSEAADFYVFNTLSKYAETSPKTMEAVGQVGLVVSKGANALGTAAGVGLMVSFPISSVAGIAAGVTVDHRLQAVGVNQDLAEFMGTMSGMLVGGRAAQGAKVSAIEKAWAARIGANEGVGQAVQEFKAGFKETMQWTQKVAQSEAGYIAAGRESQPLNLRDRVLNNIAENKVALNSSNFKSMANQEKIFRAQNAQLAPGYGGQDNYAIVPLKKGALVYGGAPGQSSFYTDIGTVKASGLDQKDLFDLLQVAPNPKYGYRPTVRAYRVMEDMEVPFGQTLANPQNGKGGGNQFFIEDWTNLDPVRDFNIQK